ncbi:hypothetical protein [Mucilaginibacter paludis]|uniref:Uncharacterized protein n=1 Tax=Mucilaginibacter paludis DSM 18603 TaxID=714943 RepID=H1YBG7_9SPHI|nr:hypothetical protein [Mucilaginibacter paludis]EHQ25038.1 hypothetical protein Mucpa_0857 [Mucilaginibacter paludis DSM 18603]
MKKLTAILLFLTSTCVAVAQTGTYRFNAKSGASCTIAVTSEKGHISADIFAWWHTPSGRNGAFAGEGQLKNNSCVLKSADDADCEARLTFSPGRLTAKFNNCISSNLPGDFSGTYQKLTNRLPGDYIIAITKAYLYKWPGSKPLKTYLIQNNKVSVDLENITDGQWVFINFTNAAGKTTDGYMPWSALK